MAEKKYSGLNALSHFLSKLKLLIDKKVDKVEGKDLFSGSYDDLNNVPTLDGKQLKGTLTKSDLGIADATELLDAQGDIANAEADILEIQADVTTLKGDVSGNKTDIDGLKTSVSALEEAGYQTADDVEQAITAKGYQTSSDVEKAITGKGYQTASDVETAITEKGYQTASDVEDILSGKDYQTSTQVNAAITSKGYQTADEVSQSIADAIKGISGVKYSVVEQLPDTGEAGTIYLVSKETEEEQNIYDEYIWVTDKFEQIGTTAVDLSQYVKNSDLVEITNEEIDSLFE